MTKRFKKGFCIFVVVSISIIFSSNLLLAQGKRVGAEVKETAMKLQRLIRQKQAEGVDVSKAIELDRQSREAMRRGRPQECLRLLKKAIALLGKGQRKGQEKDQPKPRISFFEVHLEPGNANDEVFNALSELVALADQYKVKLTLLFTPQWAEMILRDNYKLSLLHKWQQNDHEIGGHHHGSSVCPWDGYTNLDANSQEFKNRQNRVSCPKFVRAKEKYLGNINDYMELLNKLGSIKTITMSDADVDWPNGAVYSAGGRRLQEAISQPRLVILNSHEMYKLSSVTFMSKKTVLGELNTIDDLKDEYLSEKEGVFGVNAHTADYKASPSLYKQWFEFLNEQASEMNYAKTISQIIEESQNKIPLITQIDLERGWYWGNQGQKKPGTPDSWIHSGGGARSACWHTTEIKCGKRTQYGKIQYEDLSKPNSGKSLYRIIAVGLENKEFVINNQDEYQALLDYKSPYSKYEDFTLPEIDFSQKTLLGKYTSGSGCSIDFVKRVYRNNLNKKIIYSIDVVEKGLCEKLGMSMNWISIPKIPPDYNVQFKVKQVPQEVDKNRKNLIDANLDVPFQLKINQTAVIESENLQVRFLNVEDSRCPATAKCIWEGQATVVVNIIKNDRNLGNFNLISRSAHENLAIKTFDGYSIKLIKVDPYPMNTQPIELSDHIITLVVTKI